MQGFKLIHVNKRGHWTTGIAWISYYELFICFLCTKCWHIISLCLYKLICRAPNLFSLLFKFLQPADSLIYMAWYPFHSAFKSTCNFLLLLLFIHCALDHHKILYMGWQYCCHDMWSFYGNHFVILIAMKLYFWIAYWWKCLSMMVFQICLCPWMAYSYAQWIMYQ